VRDVPWAVRIAPDISRNSPNNCAGLLSAITVERQRVTMLALLQEAISRLLVLVRSAGRRTYVIGDSDPASVIRNAMSEYLESQRHFVRTAEICSQRGWPDRGAVLYYTWKCQQLYIQRQQMRFEYLFSRGEFEAGVWNSLSRIADRLDKNWSDIDELSAINSNDAYKDLTTEITDANHFFASMDQDLREGPIRSLQQHAEYLWARRAIYEKVHELDKRLAKLSSQSTPL
jgi:hypothetical protein